MKTKFENQVLLTLRVSKGADNKPSYKKVSDKLLTIRTYLNTGKDKDGNYNPAISLEVHIFTSEAKNPTENLLKEAPREGDYITVMGILSAKQRTIGDTKYTDYIVKATKVMAAEIMEDNESRVANDYVAESAWE